MSKNEGSLEAIGLGPSIWAEGGEERRAMDLHIIQLSPPLRQWRRIGASSHGRRGVRHIHQTTRTRRRRIYSRAWRSAALECVRQIIVTKLRLDREAPVLGSCLYLFPLPRLYSIQATKFM